MMAVAHPKLALRPFLPADAPMLAEIFRASIEELTGDDYSEAQQSEWMAKADDEQAFSDRFAKNLTLVATLNGSPVGFAVFARNEEIDMLFVHPVAVRQGVATSLCDAIEKLAAARGAKRLTVDASDTALDFFKRRGFVAQQRNTVRIGSEWAANTTMEKKLAAKERAS